MSVQFEVTRGPHAGLTVKANRPKTIVAGRASNAHLKLDQDPHFSRYHFRVEVCPPRCFLIDLGSHNGTLLNGEKTPGSSVHDGDVISGGHTEIRVRISNPEADLSAAAPSSPNRSTLQADAAAADDAAPSHVAAYRIRKQLGSGPLGTVYRARHEATGTNVALKLLGPSRVAAPDRVQRFLKKAAKLLSLNHSGIVRFLEMGAEPPFLYVATEYIPEVRIERVVRNVSLASRIRIACSVGCRALEALKDAHASSMVHGDIHPGNVLLFHDRQKLNVKLADFGLAKLYDDAGLTDITADGHVCESIAYRAPEQIIHSGYTKASSDLYSLGATLYHHLTGQHPFGKAHGVALLRKVLKGRRIPIRSVAPEIPQGLADVLDRALARDPSERWSSAEEMYNALFLFSKRSFVKTILRPARDE